MTAGWVKSLQCKAKAEDDVVQSHHLLPSSTSCRKSFKDVVETKKLKSTKPKTPVSRKPDNNNNNNNNNNNINNNNNNISARTSNESCNPRRQPRPPESCFPALTDLPVGHPSRNVVEIIFHTSWSPKVFSGRVEMVFKVQNSGRTVTRFEEYRELIKSGSGRNGVEEDHERCVADGNEVMRFQCLGPTGGGACEANGGAWTLQWGKGAALCTFTGSWVAHDSVGGGRGRKAMLVCRVIAGRVRKQGEFDSGYDGRVGCDSVSGENGELFVFDSRAVLPCFLIIYRL